MSGYARCVRPLLQSLARAFVGLVLTAIAVATLPHAATAADFDTYEIVTKSGVRTFMVETARTDAERGKGLMYRRELPEGRGMIFDFRPEQEVTMWMKNTYVSLDMIFIRANGQIWRIAENTKTESEDIVSSRGNVGAVLEVVAGTAKKLGIAPGDRVAGPLFNRR
jgi:uncharacterized protein